jgi:hypothetical protein
VCSRLPAKTSIVVSRRVASNPSVRWGNHDLDKEDIAGRMLGLPLYRSWYLKIAVL